MRATRRLTRQRFSAGLLVAVVSALLWPLPAAAVERPARGYVIDGASGVILGIDVTRATVAARVPTNLVSGPHTVKVSRDGRRAFVSGTAGVSVIDTATDAVIDAITVPGCAYSECRVTGIDISFDGALLYVAMAGSQHPSPHSTVAVIDVATHSMAASIPLGEAPADVAIAPDARLYVALYSGKVAVVDTVTRTVNATIVLSEPALALAVSPNGGAAYVTTEGIGRTLVSVIETETNTVRADIPVAHGARGVAVSPNGTRVYVASLDDTVTVIDTATNTAVATVLVHFPERVAVSPDGGSVYVSNVADGTVTILDAFTNRVVGDVQVGQAPLGIAFAPNTSAAYVANYNSGDLHVIDIATRSVRSVVYGGIWLRRIAIEPRGRFAYVTTFAYHPGTPINGSALLVVDTDARKVVARIALDTGGHALAVSPDGAVVYVLGTHLAVVNTATNVVTDTIPLPDPDLGSHSALALSPDGRSAFVAGTAFPERGGDRVNEVRLLSIDIATGAVVSFLAQMGTGNPVDLSVSPDGRFAYVAIAPQREPPSHHIPRPTPQPSAAGVLVWDVVLQNVVSTIPIDSPQSVAWVADRTAYATNARDSIAVIEDHQVASVVPIGVVPQRIAVTADRESAYVVSFPATVRVIDVASQSVTAMLLLGGQPTDIAIGATTGATPEDPPSTPTRTERPDDVGHTPTASRTTTLTPTCTAGRYPDPGCPYEGPPSPTTTPTPCATASPPSCPPGSLAFCWNPQNRCAPSCACVTLTPTATATPPCSGDCNGDGSTRVDEIMLGVNILLGQRSLDDCRAMDRDGNTSISVGDLVQAVNAAIEGCPELQPTATPITLPMRCHSDRECGDLGSRMCLEPGGFPGCGICYEDSTIDQWMRCTSDSECLERWPGVICQPLGHASHTCSPCNGAVSVCLEGCSEERPCEVGQVCEQFRCVGRPCGQGEGCPDTHDCMPLIGGEARCMRHPCVTDIQCGSDVCVEGACYTELGRCQLIPG